MKSKKRLTLTGLALIATFALTGCGPSAQPQGGQSTAAATQDSNKFPAGDTINDGKGDYQLAGVAENDPINTVDMTVVDADTLKYFDKDDIQQAQKLVGNYISEAIDSPMRLSVFKELGTRSAAVNKIESDFERRLVSKYFAKGYMVNYPDDPANAPDYRNPARSLTDVQFEQWNKEKDSAAFSYDYGTDKQRMLTRTMTVQGVSGSTPVSVDRLGNRDPKAPMVDLGPILGMKVDVINTNRARLAGQPLVESQHTVFHVGVVKQDGKFVIYDASVDNYKAP